jgi:hypothetical protein
MSNHQIVERERKSLLSEIKQIDEKIYSDDSLNGTINISYFSKRETLLKKMEKIISKLSEIKKSELRDLEIIKTKLDAEYNDSIKLLKTKLAEKYSVYKENTISCGSKLDGQIEEIKTVYDKIYHVHQKQKQLLQDLQISPDNIKQKSARGDNVSQLWSDAIRVVSDWEKRGVLPPGIIPKPQHKEEPRKTIVSPGFQKIYVTKKLYLKAKTVSNLKDVAMGGQLHYVTKNEIFGIYIGDTLFYGSIGVIYAPVTKQPTRIVTCRHNLRGCQKGDECSFYHDQALFSDSKDVRNYTSQNLHFNPMTDNTMLSRFGSIDSIDIDIRNITEEEKSRQFSFTMHNILCSLLVKENV